MTSGNNENSTGSERQRHDTNHGTGHARVFTSDTHGGELVWLPYHTPYLDDGLVKASLYCLAGCGKPN
jgi:hypothetical protein